MSEPLDIGWIEYRIDNRLYEGTRSDGLSCWTWAVEDLRGLIATVRAAEARADALQSECEQMLEVIDAYHKQRDAERERAERLRVEVASVFLERRATGNWPVYAYDRIAAALAADDQHRAAQGEGK